MYKPNMEDKRLKIKIRNKTDVMLHGLNAGEDRSVQADEKGTPLESCWRRRIKDGAIVVVKDVPKVPKKTNKEDKD